MRNKKVQIVVSCLVVFNKVNHYFILFFKTLLALILIYWVIHRGYLDLTAFSNILLKPSYVLFFFGLIGLNLIIVSLRWLVLLKSQGFDLKMSYVFSLGLIGVFFNHVVPGTIGGDLMKGYCLIKDHSQRKLQAGATIVVDRILGFYVMNFLAFIALLTNGSFFKSEPLLMTTAYGVFSFFLLSTAFIVLSFSKKFKKGLFYFLRQMKFLMFGGHLIILRLYKALYSYRKDKRALLYVIGLSILAQIIIVFYFMSVGYMIGQDLGLMTYIFGVSIGLIITAIPITPAGIGVGQVAMLFLFQVYSGEYSQVGPIGLSLFQISFFIWGLVGAYLYLRWYSLKAL